MSDVFREIDEEIRQEHYLALWKKYGPWLIAAAVLLVVGVAGYKGWEGYRHDRAVAASKQYEAAVAALNDGNTAKARQQFAELADASGSGYKLLASFRLAETQAAQGDTRKAVTTWTRIAQGDAAKPYRNLATIHGVMHAIDLDGVKGPVERLRTLAGGSSAVRTTAQELEALLAVSEGDTKRAVELYTGIAEAKSAPQGQRQRAEHMLALLQSSSGT